MFNSNNMAVNGSAFGVAVAVRALPLPLPTLPLLSGGLVCGREGHGG